MKPFERFATPADTIWVTPDDTGVRFFLTPPDANGNELIGMAFNDSAVGPIALGVHPASIQAVIGGLQQVMDNIAYLRTANAKIRNEKGTN